MAVTEVEPRGSQWRGHSLCLTRLAPGQAGDRPELSAALVLTAGLLCAGPHESFLRAGRSENSAALLESI